MAAAVIRCADTARHLPAPHSLQFGSGLGFVGGLVHRWRTDVAEALHVTQHYPRLIEARNRAIPAGPRAAGRRAGTQSPPKPLLHKL